MLARMRADRCVLRKVSGLGKNLGIPIVFYIAFMLSKSKLFYPCVKTGN